MLREKIEQTIGAEVVDLGIAILREYSIVFNKYSTRDRTGKTNIIASEFNVIGVVYDLTEEQFTKLGESEGGYHIGLVTIQMNNEIIKAQTYFANGNRINNELYPTREYRQILINGAREHDFPTGYIQMLEAIQTVD